MLYVLVNVPLRVHYGNYWMKGCGREANRLETIPLSPIIPVVYERNGTLTGLLCIYGVVLNFAESLSLLKNASQS